MISRAIKQLLNNKAPAVRYAFSSHDEPPPSKLSKVKDVT